MDRGTITELCEVDDVATAQDPLLCFITSKINATPAHKTRCWDSPRGTLQHCQCTQDLSQALDALTAWDLGRRLQQLTRQQCSNYLSAFVLTQKFTHSQHLS
ncbi:kmt5c [Pungitius sinensis]